MLLHCVRGVCINSIRLNFLEHLDSWKTTQVDNATKIVVEKVCPLLRQCEVQTTGDNE